MFIRNSFIKDIAEIIEIGSETNLSIWTADDYKSEFVRPAAVCFTIIDENDTIAGFMHGRFNISAVSEKNIFELHNIAVGKQFWNKGFGSALFAKLITECLEREAAEIILNVRISNHPAIAFYTKYGFEIVSTEKLLYSNPAEDGFLMVLSL